MPLLSHPNEGIVIETMAFLEALLEFGNTNVQKGFDELTLLHDNRVFLTLQKKFERTIVSYQQRYK